MPYGVFVLVCRGRCASKLGRRRGKPWGCMILAARCIRSVLGVELGVGMRVLQRGG